MSDLKFEVGKTYETCEGFESGKFMGWARETGLSNIGDTFVVERVDGDGDARVGSCVAACFEELQSGSVKLVEEKVEDTSHSPDLELHASTTQQGLKWDLIHMYIKDKFNGNAEEATTSGSSRLTLEDGIIDLEELFNSHTNTTGGVGPSGPPGKPIEGLGMDYYNFDSNSSPEVSEELLGTTWEQEELAEMLAAEKEVTGGSSPSYYRKAMLLPMTNDRSKFVMVDLEVGDIIDTFNLNFNQGNVLKSVTRGDNKEGVDVAYALDKQIWFSLREKLRHGIITQGQFWEQAVALGLSKEK